jgi:hypothetical protein
MLAMSETLAGPGAQFSFVAFAKRWLVRPVVKTTADELHRHDQRWFLELDAEEVL